VGEIVDGPNTLSLQCPELDRSVPRFRRRIRSHVRASAQDALTRFSQVNPTLCELEGLQE